MAKQKGLSKAHKQIVTSVVERWENTIFNGQPNIERAKEYLRAGYTNGIGVLRSDRVKEIKNIDFYVVDSLAAFFIAVAVVCGRMTKKAAYELCKQLDIDRGFVRSLRRDTLCRWNSRSRRWWTRINNEFTRVWLRAVREEFAANESLIANTPGFWRRWWLAALRQEDTLAYSLNSPDRFSTGLSAWLTQSIGAHTTQRTMQDWQGKTISVSERPAELRRRKIQNQLLPDAASTAEITGHLTQAINVDQLLSDESRLPNEDGGVFLDGITTTALDAEILCNMLKLDTPEITWEFEVFHHLTNFATFQRSCVVLAQRPTIHTNEAENLHREDGPAVHWPDGLRLYFNDGHFIDEYGATIVDNPRDLTTQKILQIRNQETRRLAITAFGWERFLVEAECPILDQRQNDVDNTIEMLVGPPTIEANDGSRAAYVMLFCRSTGRRYFLAVPRDVATCEEAQNWMANAGTNLSLPYAKQPIRLVGAS